MSASSTPSGPGPRLLRWAAIAGVVGAVAAVLALVEPVLDATRGPAVAPTSTPATPVATAGTSPAAVPTEPPESKSAPASDPTHASEPEMVPSPVESTGSPTPKQRGRLAIVRVEPGSLGMVGVDRYRPGVTPGFGITVYTGDRKVRHSDKCFVSWTYEANEELVSRGESRCASGGITPFGSGPLREGTGVVRAKVETAWGESGSDEYRFSVG